MYSFKRLIKRYTKIKPLLKTTAAGYRDYENGGVWVDGEVEWVEIDAAVLPLGKELIFDNSGYTTDDKKLYTYEEVNSNEVIKHKDRLYTTMEHTGYEEYDEGLKVLILKAGGKND